MATDSSLAFQAALISAIKALATEAGNNVFDTVPTSNPFPRVTIGGGQTVPVVAGCYDGSEVFYQIDVWSRAVGFPECKRIASAIRQRLHTSDLDAVLSLSGHTLELMEIESIDYSRDPDGLTSRARISLRAQTQPVDSPPDSP